MENRIIASIKLPFCQLIKTKRGNYAVKIAVGTSYYSKSERKIAFKHFRNEMNWGMILNPDPINKLRTQRTKERMMSKQEIILQVIDCKDYADVASMIREADSVTVILRALEIAHRNGMKAAATMMTSEASRVINHVNASADLEKSLAN